MLMQKAEPKKENKPRQVSFRLSEERYREAEEWAAVEQLSVHEWCREVTEGRLKEGRGMDLHERLFYEEIARLRFITGQCFRLLAREELDEEAWEKVRDVADTKGAEIADNLLRRALGDKEQAR